MLSIRRALNASCAAAAPQTCVMHTLSPRQHSNGLAADTQRAVVALYARSVFCLQPIGDACVRTGVIDSMLLGCIPGARPLPRRAVLRVLTLAIHRGLANMSDVNDSDDVNRDGSLWVHSHVPRVPDGPDAMAHGRMAWARVRLYPCC